MLDEREESPDEGLRFFTFALDTLVEDRPNKINDVPLLDKVILELLLHSVVLVGVRLRQVERFEYFLRLSAEVEEERVDLNLLPLFSRPVAIPHRSKWSTHRGHSFASLRMSKRSV